MNLDRRTCITGMAGIAALALFEGCDAGFSMNTPATPHDIGHILMTGQSLARGDQSLPILTRTQPFSNLMFASSLVQFPGVKASTLGATNVQFVPLTATPTNNPGASDYETCGNGMADTVIAATPSTMKAFPQISASNALLVSCSSLAALYADICGPTDYAPDHVNGSPTFQETMSQVTQAKLLAAAQNRTYHVPCIVVIHGEFDDYNPNYLANLVTWQNDIQTGVKKITGQTETIPFILTQTCPGDTLVGTSSYAQWQAAVQYPDKMILAGPEYQIPHNTPDLTHLTIHLPALGQRMLGAMVARAYRKVFLEGGAWQPLMPQTVTIAGNEVVIEYIVPVAPLHLDSSWCTDPGNYGFTYSDASGAAITSVAVTGPTEVTLTLNKNASATNRNVGYAVYDLDPLFGPINGTRGCLHDSATDVGYYDIVDGVPPQNYCVRWSGKY